MTHTSSLGQRLAAEALGTFVLVLFGVGAALMSRGDYLTTGLSFGLAVLVMAGAVGRVSGGHFNPAVSLGSALAGRLSWRDTPLYWLAQLAGGIAGGLVLWVLMRGFAGFRSEGGFGQNSFGAASPEGYAWWAAFLLEAVMTAIFVGVVLGATDARNPHPSLAPVVIGLALAVIHFASMRATGTSVNPARSVGAGLFAGVDALKQLWLFVAAPLAGALVTGLVHPAVFGRDGERVPGSGIGRRRPTDVAMPGVAPDASAWDGWTEPDVTGERVVGRHAAEVWPPAERDWPPPVESWPPVADPGPREWGRPDAGPTGQPWTPPSEFPSSEPAPWEQDILPPPPTEPYWSQQLPEDWNSLPDDDDGRTQLRPPEV